MVCERSTAIIAHARHVRSLPPILLAFKRFGGARHRPARKLCKTLQCAAITYGDLLALSLRSESEVRHAESVGEPPFPGMVWIPGGTFRMGSDTHHPEERPSHRVTVDGFWIDHPVVHISFADAEAFAPWQGKSLRQKPNGSSPHGKDSTARAMRGARSEDESTN